MSEEIPIPYIAGFFDGEGGASIHVSRYGRAYAVSQSVYFSNRNLDVLEKIRAFLKEKYGLNFRIHLASSKIRPSWKKQYTLGCYTLNDVLSFTALILPYLIVKREEVQLLRNFCLEKMKHGLTENAIKLYEEYKSLKRRSGRRKSNGRPRKNVDKDVVIDLLRKDLSMRSIALTLGVSSKTLKRRLYEWGIEKRWNVH